MNKEKKNCTPCERARLARIAARKAQEEKIQKQQKEAIKIKTTKKMSTLNIKKDDKVIKKEEKADKEEDIIPCEECDQVKE